MNKNDGRNRNKDTQKEIRFLAVEAVNKENKPKSEVARLFKISRQALDNWLKKAKRKGIESLKEDNRGGLRENICILNKKQLDWIRNFVETKTPEEFKLSFLLWTREAIQELVKRKYKKFVDIRTIGIWLKKWGMSFQKPAKQAKEQDPEEVKQWYKEQYPKIREKAKKENAEIYWGDESGIQSTHNIGKAYSKIGKTPKIKISGKIYRCNMISAISNLGKMRFRVFEGSFTAEILIDFMKRLIKTANKKVFLILDNHQVHKKSKKTLDWIEAHKEEIEVFYLPRYSPEVNPDEYLNNHLKKIIFKEKRSESLQDLKSMMVRTLKGIQVKADLILSYFKHPLVSYINAV